MTSSALKSLQAVAQSARTHRNPAVRVITLEKTLPYGHTIRQGDVMLTRHPLGTVFPNLGPVTKERQLAPGSTPGSRHILREGTTIVSRSGADVLHGPIVEAPRGFYLEHPRHGDIDCKLPGSYEVTFPRDLAAEGLARRQD